MPSRTEASRIVALGALVLLLAACRGDASATLGAAAGGGAASPSSSRELRAGSTAVPPIGPSAGLVLDPVHFARQGQDELLFDLRYGALPAIGRGADPVDLSWYDLEI